MKNKPKKPFIPPGRQDTVRQEIISALEGQTLSARDISGEVGISEKDVYDHLEHIRRTLSKTGQRLAVTPAECKKCGFSFKKREKLKKPGKCPICRGESIEDPLFSLKNA